MSIRINKFIDVDIQLESLVQTVGAYKTTVYVVSPKVNFTNLADSGYAVPQVLDATNGLVTHALCSSYEQVEALVAGSDNESSFVKLGAKQYFNNGGAKLLLVRPSFELDTEAEVYTAQTLKADVEKCRTLANDFIFVCVSNLVAGKDSYFTYSTLKAYAELADSEPAPYTVRLLLTTASTSASESRNFIQVNDFNKVKVGVKYCTKAYNSIVIDAALLIGAYYSKLNLDGTNTLKDYCFTEEILVDAEGKDISIEGLTDDEYEHLTQTGSVVGYYNVIDKLANKQLNLGGNYSSQDNVEITTDFGNICVENDICGSMLETIIGKQYLTQAGMNNLITAVNKQMTKYMSNGYLNKGAEYSGSDYTYNYNGRTYTICKKGTALSSGYLVYGIPVVNISAQDLAARRFPPIIVLMETQHGARQVVVRGEVR